MEITTIENNFNFPENEGYVQIYYSGNTTILDVFKAAMQSYGEHGEVIYKQFIQEEYLKLKNAEGK